MKNLKIQRIIFKCIKVFLKFARNMVFLKLCIINGVTNFFKVQKKDWKMERNSEFSNGLVYKRNKSKI